MIKLLSGSNAKIDKSNKQKDSLGFLSCLQYLAPYKSGNGETNLCPLAELFECIDGCLVSAGRMHMSNADIARQKRTELMLDNWVVYCWLLVQEISDFEAKAKRAGLKAAVRLNGTSDIQWERKKILDGKTIFELFPDIQFYDYTKILKRLDKKLPVNYHLTMSASFASATSKQMTLEAIDKGHPIAMVFRDKVPAFVVINGKRLTVVDADAHDLTFKHAVNGQILGLKAKGKAKKDTSGFVVDINAKNEVSA